MSGVLRRVWNEERGIGLPSVLILLVIVLIVAATASALAITALSETRRDRASAEAFQVADSAVDLVGWHMNRHVVANETQALVGIGEGTVQTEGCIDVAAGALVLRIEADAGATWCPPVEVPDLVAGADSTCRFQLRIGVDLTDPAQLVNNLLTRNVVCQGEAGGVQRRILARMALQIDSGSPTTLWRRDAWVECTGEFTDPLDPAAGCPSLPPV